MSGNFAINALGARPPETPQGQQEAPCPICLQVEGGGTLDFMAAARAQLATQATRASTGESSRLAEALAPPREASHRGPDPQNKRTPERAAPDAKTASQSRLPEASAQGSAINSATLGSSPGPSGEVPKQLAQQVIQGTEPLLTGSPAPGRARTLSTDVTLARNAEGSGTGAATPTVATADRREQPARLGSEPLAQSGASRAMAAPPREPRTLVQPPLASASRTTPPGTIVKADGRTTPAPRSLAHSADGRLLVGVARGKAAVATQARAPLSAPAVAQARQGARAQALLGTAPGRNAGTAQAARTVGFAPPSGSSPFNTDIARAAAKLAPWEQRQTQAPLVPRSNTLGWYGLALAQRLGLSPAQILELLAELEDAREAEEAAELARVEAVEDGEAEDGEQHGAESQSGESDDADGKSV